MHILINTNSDQRHFNVKNRLHKPYTHNGEDNEMKTLKILPLVSNNMNSLEMFLHKGVYKFIYHACKLKRFTDFHHLLDITTLTETNILFCSHVFWG